MNDFTDNIYTKLKEILGEDIGSFSILSSATSASIYRLRIDGKPDKVIKISNNADLGIEVFMINYLKENTTIPLPNIIHADNTMVVMEYIESDWRMDHATERNMAEYLVALHDIKADKFGFEQETAFGGFAQNNSQTDNWSDFFIQNRLLHTANIIFEEGLCDKKLMKKINKLVKKIPDMIGNYSKPSLIHGNVWGGNVLSYRGKIQAFIDPALYYADPEIELAFMYQSKSFSNVFFQKYNELRGIRHDFFEERMDLYNIYPLLVYAKIFGKSYVRKAERKIDKLL